MWNNTIMIMREPVAFFIRFMPGYPRQIPITVGLPEFPPTVSAGDGNPSSLPVLTHYVPLLSAGTKVRKACRHGKMQVGTLWDFHKHLSELGA